MEFLNQNMLWGLLGLGIPVWLHFFNKNNKNLIRWASTSFLEQNQPPKARSFIPKDILLLLLRCFILGLICVVLAIPLFNFAFKNKQKSLSFFEKSAEIQSQFKFEIENSKKEARFFGLDHLLIEDKNTTWEQESQFTQNKIQATINQISKDFNVADSIHIYLRSAKDFYDSPILHTPKNFQIHWGNTAVKTKIPVWKVNNSFYDVNGKVEKFENEKQQVIFDKDSLSILINEKNEILKKYTQDGIEAIKRAYKYPISIQNSEKNMDLVFGVATVSNKPYIQLTAMKSSMQKMTNMQAFTASPTNSKHSSIRMGSFPETVLAQIQAFIGLAGLVQDPTLTELNASIQKNEFEYTKSNNLDLRYLWILIILLIGFERFLSIKYSK
jgi:Aerotolerance regulator N-terminal